MAVDKKKQEKPAKKEVVTGPKLEDTIAAIHKDEGDESLRVGISSKSGVMKCEAISTRCIALDEVLGVGGVPRGRVVEIFGPESGGKTTLALTIVAEAQSKGGVAAYIDAENAIDRDYTAKIGVDCDKLLFSQPDDGEQALRIVEKLVESNKVDLVVVDSVAALVPKSEVDGEIGDPNMGAQARLMSQALRKLSSKIRKSRACVIFINQIREKIGVMPGSNPESTPGGRALKFYASIRIDIRRIASIRIGDKMHGNTVKAKVAKNKVAPPFGVAQFDIIFGKGVCTAGSLIDVGVKYGLVKKNGSFFMYGENKMGNGKAAAVEWLSKCPEQMKELDTKLREMVFSKTTVDQSPSTSDSELVEEGGDAAEAEG